MYININNNRLINLNLCVSIDYDGNHSTHFYLIGGDHFIYEGNYIQEITDYINSGNPNVGELKL
jgi:hypothetical protein